ncbi:MAG: hypothetical protein HYZ23_07875, partial [Chloroflexi bacterium]|nr:hypothetical protein [Chloroflexota bacterium]
MTLDLTLAPLYRISGKEIASLPGLIALTPPPRPAHGREKDRLIVYLLLAGNSTFSTSEYMQVAQDAAKAFYQTPRALTSALRAAADQVNKTLLERNMATTAQGQYVIGWLTLASLRDRQCTFALCGPMHAYWFGPHDMKHIHEPAVSGKGLGANQTTNVHYAQVDLQAGDRLLFFGRAPSAWDVTLNDPVPSSLDATRRRLMTLTSADLNAVLMQATEGAGVFNLLSGIMESKEEKQDEVPASTPTPQPDSVSTTPASPIATQPTVTESSPASKELSSTPTAHLVQPSAYAIPPQQDDAFSSPSSPLRANSPGRDFPASIPRIQPTSQPTEGESTGENSAPETEKIIEPEKQPEAPREPSEQTRKAAKAIASGIQSTRRINQTFGEKIGRFLPRLLPNSETSDAASPGFLMLAIAIVIPLIVVVTGFVMYSKYGRNPQYEAYLQVAKEMSAQAAKLPSPVEQRESWENVLFNVDKAEEIYRPTSETILLRQEAEANLDTLLGITRLQFNSAFPANLGIDISRMAASESDLYMLNAVSGEALRARPAGSGYGFEVDATFNCKPGIYGDYTVGPLVDILAMPILNPINATMLGMDAAGNLLYCAPNQVPYAVPLPPPDTNWGRVTAFVMDGGNLYVLDSSSR